MIQMILTTITLFLCEQNAIQGYLIDLQAREREERCQDKLLPEIDPETQQ